MWLVEENSKHGVLFFGGTPAGAENYGHPFLLEHLQRRKNQDLHAASWRFYQKTVCYF